MIVHPCSQNSDTWEAFRRGLPTASAMDKIICPEMGNLYICGDCGRKFGHARKWCDLERCKGSVIVRRVVKESESSTGFMFKLIYESLTGLSIPNQPTAFMDRGHELEPRAASAYEWLTGYTVERVGFITTDDQQLGASPDRFVNTDGMAELKAPAPWTQLEYLATPAG